MDEVGQFAHRIFAGETDENGLYCYCFKLRQQMQSVVVVVIKSVMQSWRRIRNLLRELKLAASYNKRGICSFGEQTNFISGGAC